MTKQITTFGSISSGTLLSKDLVPCFADELESILKQIKLAKRNDNHVKLLAECKAIDDCPLPVDWNSDEASEIVNELFVALTEYAPAYGYFGAHPGDGAVYGYWLSEGFPDDGFDGLKVDDLDEVPDHYAGEVLHINDHGNMTLYTKVKDKREVSEVWAIV